MLKKTIEGIFFDLDGTLLDTAPDLLNACNYVLTTYQRPQVSLSEFCRWIHGGMAMMIGKSFKIDPQHPDFPALKTTFLNYYQQHLIEKTQLFPGIADLLDYLQQNQIPWGIVTNKISALTHPILDHFRLKEQCRCIVSGDSLSHTKPRPEPLLEACRLAGVSPQHSLYVGDTQGDIQAAQAAGMHSIAVKYGYYPENSDPNDWQADRVIDHPQDLISLLQN